jgi:hypothetical protein
MHRALAWPLLAFVVFSSSCRGGESPAETSGAASPPLSQWQARIEPLELPATGVTSQPQMTVSQRGLIVSWMEQNDATFTLKFAERSGAAWSSPGTVASSTSWFVSAADVPTVMRLTDGTLVATTYPATELAMEAYDLRLSYSRDDGKTWARPLSPHHDATKTQHGFASLFELPDRGLGLVWLDGRDQALNKTDPQGGSMALYFASFDQKWKQTAETLVNQRVCECCQTAVAATDEGAVVAFRDRSPREIRDISVSRLEQETWTPERPLHVDGWQIEACPVNGPALSARGRSLAAAWFTVKNDTGQAYASFSADAGRTWREPIRLDDSVANGHVDVELLEDGSAVATWVEFADQRSQLRMRHVTPSGERSAAITVAGQGSARISGYPRIARQGDDLVLAWTEGAGDGGDTAIRAAIARIPK